jgi:hypothetical protein
VLALSLSARPVQAVAQATAQSMAPASGSKAWGHLAGQAVIALERADPIPGGGSLAELRVVQPALHLAAGAFGHLRLSAVLNLEGATIANGELAPGNWGEGFVDRRHPHTYLHELVLTADDLLGARDGAARVSLTAGKGFAPFGTDDPMVRPFLRYPVNHHLAQILERAVTIAAVRVGPLLAEAGLFNGDEPERPGQWPRIGGRFGDSWSARITGEVRTGLTAQGSYAHVHSPEHRPGAGTDQAKWSLAARWERPIGNHPVYLLAEWARTEEADGFFVFHSLLAEGAWTAGPHRLQYRFERTDRPEEERISNFRSRRPHLENSILGTTRWTTQTLGYEVRALRRSVIELRPLVEVTYGRVGTVGGGLFDVEQVYGRRDFWSLSFGARIAIGGTMHRMGRYGAAEDEMDTGGRPMHQHEAVE